MQDTGLYRKLGSRTMNEEERVLLQILLFVRANPNLNLHVHYYPTSLVIQGGYDELGNETLHHRIDFQSKGSVANDYHRLFEDLKQLKEQQ